MNNAENKRRFIRFRLGAFLNCTGNHKKFIHFHSFLELRHSPRCCKNEWTNERENGNEYCLFMMLIWNYVIFVCVHVCSLRWHFHVQSLSILSKNEFDRTHLSEGRFLSVYSFFCYCCCYSQM